MRHFIHCLLVPVLLWGSLRAQTVIRYNQLGYTTGSPKVVVLGTKNPAFRLHHYRLTDAVSGKVVLQRTKATEADYGAYGPFVHSYRISLSSITKPGMYQLVVNDSIRSGLIRIGDEVYKGTADFCLRYMRQQRCGFNPYLQDSCHTHDGYSIYGKAAGIPDGTHFDAVGGWHDASDYLQYTTTTANAVYHLLMAWRDFPHVFTDLHQSNGLRGSNGVADVLDESRWGMEWLQKMHPRPEIIFAQLADDRDHISMRMPAQDSQYGKGYERPLYYLTGEPQGLGRYKNKTEGTSSIAAKFSSAFALGATTWRSLDSAYARTLFNQALSARDYALRKPGFTNTAPNLAPYYYAEQNWVDDMELMYAALAREAGRNSAISSQLFGKAFDYARMEKHTPWLGSDTASHYQWYPFINVGHRELALATGFRPQRDSLIRFYREGIQQVWQNARQNAFYRGVPFIWCSNNLTTSFATQCLWYRQLSGDNTFRELEQANIDWLFGTNPWGTTMVYGLPAWGDTPVDPHSAFTHIKKYPIDGGLIDGPVYTSIFKGLIGLTLYQPDEYTEWQSNLAVYHDDYGDYSTNEPTMDGTASLVYLLAALEAPARNTKPGNSSGQQASLSPAAYHPAFTTSHGAIIRGDSTHRELTLVFTGHEYAEGGDFILRTLREQKIKAAFFLTGDFVRQYPGLVKQMVTDGHYVGPHSNKHLLYCDWQQRDSLLVSKAQFQQDLLDNYRALAPYGITPQNAPYFMPPYEWYNQEIAQWCQELGLTLVNNTPGTLSAADYTTSADKNYRSSREIMESISRRAQQPGSLNGYLLLMHLGAGPKRPDPFHQQLPGLLEQLNRLGLQSIPLAQLMKGKTP
jgi:peptidoglycan/xylan/chitin deacetylase (PgdA/CDA1 family)